MKKKIIFILCTLVILCLGTIVNAADFKDVKNTKYEDSVNTLVSIGLVDGYPEDNTYRPENIVTRAQMAKLMVIALGEEGMVNDAKTEPARFKDVKKEDWEYGYVNVAAEIGIINGYPDGTFNPKKTVSYAEATTMMLRALEYEDEVEKRSESWPNNYIAQAKKLDLYNSLSAVNASDGAKRGNIAILLWNMLRTGVCTVVSQNNAGLVYGEGELMINKNMSKYTYLENAKVIDVDFDSDFEEAEVIFKGEKNVKLKLDALEAAEMYGQNFNVLYNNSTKDIVKIIDTEDNNIKEGEIEKIKSNKIYIKGASSSGYSLPNKENILLYGIDNISDAVSAILVMNGSKVEYVVAFAPEKVYLALVTDTGVTVSNKEGIRVANYKASSTKAYVLEENTSVPEEDDVILYYLNSDEELVVLGITNVFSSKTVTASSSKLKFNSKTYTLSDTSYQLAEVKSSSLDSMTYSKIDDGVDSADLFEFGGVRYFIIFVGGVSKAEAALENDMKTAINTLTNYMAKAAVKNIINNEIKYTQSTFATFLTKYNAAQTALDAAKKTINTTNLTKVQNAYKELQSAYSSIKLITSLASSDRADETEKVTFKNNLRKIVNGTTAVDSKKVPTCVTNKANYTDASYKTFNTALSTANSILSSTNATLTQIKDAKTNLESSIKGLILKTDDAARLTALEGLNKVLANAQSIGTTNNKYTEDTFANFIDCWEEAKKYKTSLDAEAIKSATAKLERAIRMLDEKVDSIIALLNEKIDEAAKYEGKEEEYFTEEFNVFTAKLNLAKAEKVSTTATYDSLNTKLKELETAMENLKKAKIDDVLSALKTEAKSNYTLPEILDIVSGDESTREKKLEKIEVLETAMENESKEIEVLRKRLDAKITEGSAITTEEEWSISGYTGSFENMKTKLDNAKKVYDNNKSNSTELRQALNDLSSALAM